MCMKPELTILEIWYDILMDRITEMSDSVLSISEHNRCGIVGLLSSRSSVSMSQF
jgi:hypothetical protein